jgi:hypothetical protein
MLAETAVERAEAAGLGVRVPLGDGFAGLA